jgi:hypothetical protein
MEENEWDGEEEYSLLFLFQVLRYKASLTSILD